MSLKASCNDHFEARYFFFDVFHKLRLLLGNLNIYPNIACLAVKQSVFIDIFPSVYHVELFIWMHAVFGQNS